MKTVKVKFSDRYGQYNSKEYDYIVTDDVAVESGDFAVAHNGTEFVIVKVLSVVSGVSAKANKTLVSIINKGVMAEYEAMNTKVREQKSLFTRLEQLLAQETENNKYRILAQSNKEAADILVKLGIL